MQLPTIAFNRIATYVFICIRTVAADDARLPERKIWILQRILKITHEIDHVYERQSRYR